MVALLAAISTGCSSDVTRFDRSLYTSAVPASTDQANPYPGDVDPATTASVSGTYRAPQPVPAGTLGRAGEVGQDFVDHEGYRARQEYAQRNGFTPPPEAIKQG